MHTDITSAVVSGTENILSEHSNINSGNIISGSNDWHLWCRLCAKEDLNGNISVFFKDEQQSSGCRESTVCGIGSIADLSLAAAIGKYFWVEIKRDEVLPKMLCTECFSLVTSLVNFSERVAKVQQMFCVLLNTPTESHMDLHAMRLKYGLLDEEREHVLMQHQLPEVHYFEAKPKINDLEENIFENEALSAISANPLEQPRIKIKIKKENIVDVSPQNGKEEDEAGDKFLNEEYDDDDDDDEEYKIEKEEEESDEDNEIDGSVLAEEEAIEAEELKPLKIRIKSKHIAESIIENEETSLDLPKKRRKRKKSLKAADNDNYTCTDCPRKFKRMFHFRQHLKRAHPKTAPPPESSCSQCTKVFGTPRQLEIHAKVHLPTELRKTVPCPYCDKKFSSHTLLQTHIKYIHMKERPFICEECGVAVRTNAALRTHMLTHTDYAPYECEVCKKGFKNQIRLKNHMETHDPNKHICDECGLQLNSRSTLNRHLLVHSDEMQHKCDYCGRAFKRAKALKNHLILHTGLKPYSCDFCDRTFANGSNCRSHKKKAHPEELAAQEAAGGAKVYTKNIPKLEALKAVTKAADNLAPVVSKQSGRFAFGKKPKPPQSPLKDIAINVKQIKRQLTAVATNHRDQQLQHSSSMMLLNSTAAAVSTANNINTLHALPLSTSTALIATSPHNHVMPSSGIPNIDNIYSHIMKQATIAAHNASVLDAAATADTELTMHMKRPPSQASSCVTIEHDGTSDISPTIQQRQQMQSTSPAVSSIAAVPAHFYTQIIKQNLQHEHEQQQQNLHHLQSHHQQQHQSLNTPVTDDLSSMRSPESQSSSHLTDDQSNAAASVQFYNHIRQNLQGPYM